MSRTAKIRGLVNEARFMLESVVPEIEALEGEVDWPEAAFVHIAHAARAVRLAAEKLERLANG